MIAILALVLALTYLLVVVGGFLLRNHKAHRFFQTMSPQLPVVPGPSIFSGHALSILAPKKNWKIIEDLHEQYGPTFGYYMMEQPWVSTKDLDLIKLIEVDDGHKHPNRAFLGLPFSEFNNSLWHNEDDRWRQVRRIIAPALTNRKVRSDEVSLDIESVVNQFGASLERRAKKSHDTSGGKSSSFVIESRDLSERLALAVIFLTTYKQANVIDFDCDQDPWIHHLTLAAHEISNPIVYVSMAVPAFRPICEWLNQFSYTGQLQQKIVKFIEQATDLNRVAREQHEKVQQQQEQGGTKAVNFSDVKSRGTFERRLVDTIIDSFFERKIRYDNFVGSLLFLLLAGFMTTADTITCLLWQLARNPDVQEKLRKTILEEGIDADYVTWCINETVRFHPAVPLGTGRVLGEDVEVNGRFLAKGTFVMPTTHGIHHDAKIWPEPERFNPERWRDQASFHPAAFVGFGLGARNCVGGKLATYEIKLVARMILSKYRIVACDETPDQWLFSSAGMVFTLNDQPIKVQLSPIRETEAVAA